jgi:hypothetical protein
MLTQERLKELIRYEPSTGKFYWRSTGTGRKASLEAGSFQSGEYQRIRVDGKLYRAHRLAWLYVHGRHPDGMVDHINQDTRDNRIENLRECSMAQNRINCGPPRCNTSGARGVCFEKSINKWRAYITAQGKRTWLGSFPDFDSAVAARKTAEQEHFGEFSPKT